MAIRTTPYPFKKWQRKSIYKTFGDEENLRRNFQA